MRNPSEEAPSSAPPPPDESLTGLPGFPTWRRLYLLVFGTFVFYVVALAAFTALYNR